MKHVEFCFGLSYLLLQGLELPLSLSLIEVVLALGEELLLRDIEELLIAKAELSLHLGYLPAQLIILFLDSSKILQSIEFAATDGFTLDRECVGALHEYLTAHAFNSAT